MAIQRSIRRSMVLRSLIYIVCFVLIASCTSNKTEETSKDSAEVEQVSMGEGLYTLHCSRCHGSDGKLGMSGAKDLCVSKLPDDSIRYQIEHGKGSMPAMKETIGSSEDIDSIIAYIKKFRK